MNKKVTLILNFSALMPISTALIPKRLRYAVHQSYNQTTGRACG